MGGVEVAVERDTREVRGFFGQPRSLVHIFGVEMWERLSFYGMQGILLIYLYSADDEVVYFGVLGGIAIVLGAALAVGGRGVLRLMAGVR